MKGDFSRNTFDPRKHYNSVLMQQGRVLLDADWNEQLAIARRRDGVEARDVIGLSGAPLHAPGFRITMGADGATLTIGQGRYYVEGILCENESDVAYAAQPDLPKPPDIAAALTTAQANAAILYLDVWERLVTVLDDPTIRETALGGPDTGVRLRTVWQVKALPALPAGGGGFSCGDSLTAWDNLTTPAQGALTARAQPTPPSDSPCLLPPGAGYRRLENQLYRVEIHTGGALGAATFKWSRDNGAFAVAVQNIAGLAITVADVGRDPARTLASGQWVEISDDAHELSGLPGVLIAIASVDAINRVVTVATAVQGIDMTQRPKLRRWDGASATGLSVAVPVDNNGFVALEDGVEVQFGAGIYATGDYWLIPARAATAAVEWPFATPQPPQGIVHRYARLAVATRNGATFTLQDCRKIFSPLSEQPPALHVAGVNWVNDDIVPLSTLTNGLQVTLDGSPASFSPDSGAAIATLAMDLPLLIANPGGALSAPAAGTTPSGLVTTIIDSAVSLQSNVLTWQPAKPGAEFNALISTLAALRVAKVRLTFTLKGRALWQDTGNGLAYLDGSTFGQPSQRADGSSRVHLALPSGDGRRACDFGSWFFLQLQLPPSSLIGITLSDTAVLAGATPTATVSLDFSPAAAPGAAVTLASSSPQVTFPGGNSITVAQGALQATFKIDTSKVTSAAAVTISATLTGGGTLSQVLRVQVVKVAIAPPVVAIASGQTQQFAATVTGAVVNDVVWTLMEGGAAGSVNANGFYVAPAVAAASTFHVTATSSADPSQSATATIQVTPKGKEKEKDKEKEHKDKDKDNKEIEKHNLHEVMSEPAHPIVLPNRTSHLATETAAVGQAFIRIAERPSVGPSGVAGTA